ncbi:MAG: hypothetical protein KA482_01145 [Sphingobium sp.]|nr:hypothetical protein [Sphingobium sp.]MBP9156521.1 hypothetical protein [Sphingobium sp.]
MIIRLLHHRALASGPISKKSAMPVPLEILTDSGWDDTTLITFRPIVGRRVDRYIRNITAVTRFLDIAAKHVVFYGLEGDSELAPLIIWDIVHSVAVGTKITFASEVITECLLEKSYYHDSMELLEKSDNCITFEKKSPLICESDSGLDAWTFGIPVGPEDATLLNVVVKRILELNVPRKEILLCGRPAENFLYFDEVRIVGEDITAPPVKICAKKNRLAVEAQFPNLCIIHDRIFLPKDFMAAVKRFGDRYPIVTFQSVFFDDYLNLIPRRYSDYGISFNIMDTSVSGFMRDNDTRTSSKFAPSVFPITERSGFYAGNARRYLTTAYATGSMYLCKRSLWKFCPQNENLNWIEFEDLEHAYRASDAGIPSRVNPHTLTQSLISRPLLGRATGTYIEPLRGPPSRIRAWTEWLPLKRKPAIKMTHADALRGLKKFADKYVPSDRSILLPSSSVIKSEQRIRAIADILSQIQFPLRENALREVINDYQKWVVADQLPYGWIEYACHQILIERKDLVQLLLFDNDIMLNHIAARPTGGTFAFSMQDYLVKRTVFLIFFSFFTGLYLFLARKKFIYLAGGPLKYIASLINSTPYRNR